GASCPIRFPMTRLVSLTRTSAIHRMTAFVVTVNWWAVWANLWMARLVGTTLSWTSAMGRVSTLLLPVELSAYREARSLN
ncbi:hypothetical protein Cfor_08034, partial [Coptotermes formosanus]